MVPGQQSVASGGVKIRSATREAVTTLTGAGAGVSVECGGAVEAALQQRA